jgi:pilus assembly protein Flp/PilA
MVKLFNAVKKFVVREEGPTMTEYALMVALIAVVCIAAVTALGNEVKAAFNAITTAITNAVSG